MIAVRDSTFIFGSVGTGRAALDINGTPVRVHPNGAFLAFLPVPPAERPAYEIRAVSGADTIRLTHPVRLAPPPLVLADTGPLAVDSASVTPRGAISLRPRDLVRVGVRAPRNAAVWLVWPGGGLPLLPGGLTPLAAGRDTSLQAGFLTPRDPYRWIVEAPASVLAQSATILVARGVDTVRLAIPPISVDTAAIPALVVLGAATTATADPDRVVVGRSIPDPSGTSKWFLLPGTIVEMTGRMAGYTRVRMDGQLEIWVEDAEVAPLAPGASPPRPTLLSGRVAPAAEWVDLALPIGDRVPFLVEERPRALELTLYGVKVSVDVIAYAASDSLVRMIEAVQETSERARLTIHLDAPPFGWLARWEDGRLVLRIRRPPRVERRSPLRGLTIAVDPGHPPIGARGPTGLYEADAVLEIAMRAKRLLEDRGATVVMTRTTPDPVALADRPVIARRANAHAFVSIHLNAYPDGVNPFVANGTGTYFYFAHGERLARAVQRGMVARMGLRDVGVFQQSFAVVRNSWMPAVLCEGAFLMIPEQEAALRTPEFQLAYARGVVDGLEAYFRTLEDER
jgi:N-acetylmuramoyl-L-alanine amidase